ncbi:MAG TPA: hypothetical protein VFY64_04300 [Nitrososphaeraceae archaeon]|nr:hypothetical protein [Nitrososphaeraceae archaeon]
MVKDLFVRDFDEKLHAKASHIATNDHTTLASIVTDAVDKWIKNYEKIRHRHNLILYSDEISLSKILGEIDKLAPDNWFKSFCGPPEHYGVQILNKRKWFDATANNYDEFLEKPQETATKVMEIINNEVGGSRRLLPLTVAFLVEDLARKGSIKKAAGFCEWYETKSTPGITYCITNVRNVLTESFDDLFNLFNAHNGVFFVKTNKIYRLRLDDEHFYSLLI